VQFNIRFSQGSAQHISGVLVDPVPSFSALHLIMRQWKNY